ncbi:MAG TPA: hypothetical protein VFR07_05195 [Mycobacteriales bacterium]|jgi:nucleoid-associated protein YgaU|nr:hypothetical protein [Mycobacteriales bacterium]
MSTRTRPPAADRLPSPAPRPDRRPSELRTGLLGVLGLLAVVVGVPVALLLLVGNPLPTTAPSRDWLTADVSTTTVLHVLAAALWLAWAHFAACVLTEWRAAWRGRGLPGQVPLGGGSQLLARRLVAAALLLAGAATLTAPGSTPAQPADTAVSQTLRTPAADPAPVVPAADPAAAPQGVAGAPKTYTVLPPDGRRYDCLWDIAERTLGDPLRYKEIFELNRERRQDDGRMLVDADLIQPGWVLRLPADARGPGVSTPALVPVAPLPASAPAPAPAQAPAPAAEGTPALAATDASTDTGIGTDRLLLGGGLLAAGLLVALTARRGPYGRPTEDEVEEQLRVAATPGRALLLDRGLRTLAATCAAQSLDLPEVVLATCDDDELVLSLVGAGAEPPAPWRLVGDGRGWALSAVDLPDTTPDAPAPYPALAGIAVLSGVDVLVDLEAAPGLVALGGDRLVAREIVTSLVVELVTNRWSDGIDVTAVGFGDDLGAIDSTAVRTVDRLDDVLPALEDAAPHSAQGVLSGRLARSADRDRPRVVVLSGPPTPEQAERLSALVQHGRTALAVVCVGDAPSARWRFVVEADGTLDLGVLGVRAQARRLARHHQQRLHELLRQAAEDRAEQARAVAALTPAAAAGAAPPLPTGPAGARVQLLGPVSVTAPGPVEPAARARLTELVVAVALQREGVHEAVLRSRVWPRGVGDDVLAATLLQAQAWLGRGPGGVDRLARAADGRWTLADDVHCDDDLLRAGAAQARGPGEEALLRRALSGVTGEAFSGVPGDRYGWLVFHRAARDARALGTTVARRAAALALARDDRAAAEQVLRTGLQLVPAAEPLWRDLLRLLGPGAPAAAAAREAYEVLAARGLRAEPETDALVQQLLPAATESTAVPRGA